MSVKKSKTTGSPSAGQTIITPPPPALVRVDSATMDVKTPATAPSTALPPTSITSRTASTVAESPPATIFFKVLRKEKLL
jgi:hypothetical protein